MIGLFLKHMRLKKMIRTSYSFILKESAKIIGKVVDHFSKEGHIKSELHQEVLKLELTAALFWFLQRSGIFPEVIMILLLSDMHNQYYSRLRKHGYDSKTE